MDKRTQKMSAEQKNRISFIKILALVVLLGAAGIYAFVHFYNRYNDKILYAERLNQMREVTTQLFSGLEDVVKSGWNNAQLQSNFLRENNPKSVDELLSYMEKQVELSGMAQSLSGLIAIDSDGIYYTEAGRNGLLQEQRYLLSKPERISFISDSIFGSSTKMVYLIQLPEPLTIKLDEKTVDITYYGIARDMEGMSPYFNCKAYDGNNGMYVVDEQGTKIFSDEKDNTLVGYNLYSVLEQMEYLHNTSFAQTKQELDETGLAYSNAILEGEEYYYALYRMNHAAWTLIFTVPSRYVATNTVDLVRTSTRIILIFSGIMFIVFVTLITLLLTRQQRIMLEQERQNNDNLASALKKAERAEKSATEANKAKSEFLSNMSHDIRTPMNAIVGLTQLMEHEEQKSEKMVTYIRKIQNSSQHLLSLINDILDMSKIEAAEVVLNHEELNLADLVSQVDGIIRLQAEAREQTFAIQVHKIVHENLICDAMRLRQIMINLLSNAVKYTPKTGKVLLELEELPSDDKDFARLQITVTDNGYGMTREFVTHIFEPFTRAENSTTNKVQGTGLGMAITKHIVDMMGGTITIESEPDAGSCFHVILPMLINQTVKQDCPVKEVLLVSDDKVLLENVRASFKKADIQLHEVASVTEAKAVLQSCSVDTILLNGRQQDLEITDVVSALREKMPDAIIFRLVDDPMEQEAFSVKKQPYDGVIVRPFFLSKLIHAVNRMKGQNGLGKAPEGASLRGLHFLCAEDNELNAEILNSLMEINGATCTVYPDGSKLLEAFETVKPGDFDAILMDVQMPVMNGLEATREIRNSDNPVGRNIPIIAMTANAFSSDVQDCLDAGMDAHVSKPIDIGILESALNTVLNRVFG